MDSPRRIRVKRTGLSPHIEEEGIVVGSIVKYDSSSTSPIFLLYQVMGMDDGMCTLERVFDGLRTTALLKEVEIASGSWIRLARGKLLAAVLTLQSALDTQEDTQSVIRTIAMLKVSTEADDEAMIDDGDGPQTEPVREYVTSSSYRDHLKRTIR